MLCNGRHFRALLVASDLDSTPQFSLDRCSPVYWKFARGSKYCGQLRQTTALAEIRYASTSARRHANWAGPSYVNVSLAPAMACALPASGMTASERACCKQMRGRCGAARMPASHSCCRTSSELHQVDGAQPQSHWTPPDPAIVPGLPVACTALLLPVCENVSTAWHYHPPPLSLSAGTTVLRI